MVVEGVPKMSKTQCARPSNDDDANAPQTRFNGATGNYFPNVHFLHISNSVEFNRNVAQYMCRGRLFQTPRKYV